MTCHEFHTSAVNTTASLTTSARNTARSSALPQCCDSCGQDKVIPRLIRLLLLLQVPVHRQGSHSARQQLHAPCAMHPHTCTHTSTPRSVSTHIKHHSKCQHLQCCPSRASIRLIGRQASITQQQAGDSVSCTLHEEDARQCRCVAAQCRMCNMAEACCSS